MFSGLPASDASGCHNNAYASRFWASNFGGWAVKICILAITPVDSDLHRSLKNFTLCPLIRAHLPPTLDKNYLSMYLFPSIIVKNFLLQAIKSLTIVAEILKNFIVYLIKYPELDSLKTGIAAQQCHQGPSSFTFCYAIFGYLLHACFFIGTDGCCRSSHLVQTSQTSFQQEHSHMT